MIHQSFFADKTGFSDDDLELFWTSLAQMFDLDRSASRGLMAPQALIIFEHDSKLGNAPAHQLFERVSVERKDTNMAARHIGDYAITVNNNELPEGIRIIRRF